MAARKARSKSATQARIDKLEAMLAHERRTNRVLREVGLAIGSVVDLDQVLELILSKIAEVLVADRATLYLLDEGNKQLISRVMVGETAQTITVPVGHGIAGMVARTGKPIRVRDAYRDKRFMREWDDLTGYRTRTILAAPMQDHVGRIIGVVQVLNKVGGEFTVDDERLLLTFATQAAVTVDNSRMYLAAIRNNLQLVETKEQLEHRVRDLKLLFDLESAMAHAATVEVLLGAALAESLDATRALGGAVLLTDDLSQLSSPRDNGSVASLSDVATIYCLAHKTEGARVETIFSRPNDGFLGSVLARGEACIEHDLPDTSPEVRSLERALDRRVTAAVCAPLEGHDGNHVGVIALYGDNEEPGFTDEELYLVRLIAANVSTAVQLYRARVSQERAERLTTIGRLLSSVIHDLKTPLTVVSGFVQLMVNETDPKVRAEYAEMVQKQYALIQQMQREVLEFAKGQKSILVRRVYLSSFMRGLEQSLQPELEGTKVEFKVIVDDRGTANLDEGKLTRALYNLVRNALEAMGKKGGSLTVRVAREGNAVTFSVSDTGPGIPPEIRGRLFQSFVSAGKKGGTGLGLAVVKKIVDEHGGHIDVETSNKGTTFRLVLPQPDR